MMKNKFLLPKSYTIEKGFVYIHPQEKQTIFSKSQIGEEQEGVFYPNYTYLKSISESFNTVIVNTKNAWQFTLGKALAFDAVVKEETINTKPYFFVKNGNNEILGIVEKKEKSYYNIFDIGWYLRRELNA